MLRSCVMFTKGVPSQRWMYFSTLVVCSSNLSMSLAAAWTSPTLAALLEDPGSGVGPRQAAVLDALLPGGAVVGGLMARGVLDKIGRKQANALGGFLIALSWLILAFPSGVGWMYAARFIAGLAVGTLYLASGIYVAEVSSSEVRQMLFAVSQVFTNLGFLVEYCVGPYVRYETLVLISGAPSLLYLAVVPFVVESPYHLVSKGYYEEARAILQTIRGTEDVAKEFKSIQEAVGESEDRTLQDLLKGNNRRALLLASGAMLAKQLTGSWAIVSYAGPLLAEAGLPGPTASLLLGLAKLGTSVVTILLVLRFGIKRLVVLSLVGITLCLVTLLGYFVAKQNLSYSLEGFLWVPLAALIVYFIFNDFGIGPFPSFIGAELFTQKSKGTGTALALTVGHLSGLLTILLFTSADFFISLGVFAASTAVSVPLIAGFLVETSGRTLAEIQTTSIRRASHNYELHL